MTIYILAAIVLVVLLAALAIRAIGGDFTLVEDWKKAYKFYSTYGLMLIAFLPDVFNALVSGGYFEADTVGDKFNWWVKIAAAGTFAIRMVKQVKPPKSPFDPSDSAGA